MTTPEPSVLVRVSRLLRRRRSSLVGTVVAVAIVVGAVFAVRAWWDATQHSVSADHCDIGSYQLDTDQASVAATMVGEVSRYQPALPERAAVLVLAAGLQESKLRNLALGAGDRDSVGVLQQRPSQGWGGGDPKKLNDVREATREFLAALVKIPNWQHLQLAVAVQDVQISADGSLYAQHEPEAQTLADALQGHRPAAITCTFRVPTKVASTATVAALVSRELPINPPTTGPRTVQVPGAHWQTAAWFVANADRLGIDSVGYDGRLWTRADGWRSSSAPASAVTATMHRV
jgi:hypothetical protein